jgi:arginyl-tRNA synthetase
MWLKLIKHEIEELVLAAVRRAQEEGTLPSFAVSDAVVDRPQRPEHGDYASSLPMRLARTARMNPLEIAKVIAAQMEAAGSDAVTAVEVAPPGFINVRLSREWRHRFRSGMRATFGNIDLGRGQCRSSSFQRIGWTDTSKQARTGLGDTIACLGGRVRCGVSAW